ncbi:hypothetical protein NNJEOMEG_02341 [Fundidesulfovibrio magnetotacticus]|uniref:Uncharacterized protein n=1 Tax=Fundidesulfovibrio magnetotacticus TaxID=2730080 RepID=A0A6V8M212_9BACT|nr:hypothetical protein [Fundidesulfovibrio magnetotacticus]GFK94495.1 hypothetical protein NNJEOMEG_02341 [Fundidesulfovibrio magnetotacticus]
MLREFVPASEKLPVDRAWSMSIVIKSFKGRKDVEVHLFRPEWDCLEEDSFDWNDILGDPMHPDMDADMGSGRKLVMESFTPDERDMVAAYFEERYAGKLAAIRACPIDFPVPLGIPALCDLEEGKDMGFVLFDRIPNYALPFPVRGFFDLSQHAPIVEVEEGS